MHCERGVERVRWLTVDQVSGKSTGPSYPSTEGFSRVLFLCSGQRHLRSDTNVTAMVQNEDVAHRGIETGDNQKILAKVNLGVLFHCDYDLSLRTCVLTAFLFLPSCLQVTHTIVEWCLVWKLTSQSTRAFSSSSTSLNLGTAVYSNLYTSFESISMSATIISAFYSFNAISDYSYVVQRVIYP